MPQEDSAQLSLLRNNLTPFLKAITQALSVELEQKDNLVRLVKEKEAIFAKIIQNLPAENSTSSLLVNWAGISSTLKLEFEQLKRMNIK